MVDELAPLGEVVPRAQDRCTTLLALPPEAMALTRHQARADMVRLFESGMETELETVIANWWTPETQAAARAGGSIEEDGVMAVVVSH